MSNRKHKTIAELIDEIGTTKIAGDLSVASSTVRHWKRRGIPAHFWHVVAKKYGLEIEHIAALSNQTH